MHRILAAAAMKLFMVHLDLLDIPYRKQDVPTIKFDAMDSETPLNIMQRVVLGYNAGVLTLNQSLDILNLPKVGRDGEMRKGGENPSVGELPRENSQPGAENGE